MEMLYVDRTQQVAALGQGRHLRGAGGPSTPKEKEKKKKKKEKKEKRKKEKKGRKKEGNYE